MRKKEFKTESKKLMDLMINSIYTNKEIFLREIVSNASDALDKLHYNSLTDKKIKIDPKKLEINIKIDKDKRLITISDNGIGMTKDELENNLGTIAKSGSSIFKEENEHKKDIDIIGQFGVGFYSAFMVSSKVDVISKSFYSDEANLWTSTGVDGYVVEKSSKEDVGTDVILTIKEDDEENYSKFLDENEIKSLIKKYSNYITYPIKINDEVINDLIPIWKRNKKSIKEEEYNTFYYDKFMDYEKPIKTIHTHAEGIVEYNSLIYIPSHAAFDYYTKEYEKGLQLYSNGVLIMEKCSDLVPDYLSFIKGVVDSSDLPLNISRETIQQNRVLKTIANSIEGKILKELEDLKEKNREDYNKFYEAFGMQIKFGVYQDYGMNKDKLKDLIMFYSSNDKKLTTLKEYVDRKKDKQDKIYYACGESVDKIDLIPQVEGVKDKGYEVLYCIDYVDEFAIKMLNKYNDLEFVNVCSETLDLDTKEEKEELNKKNEDAKDMFNIMKEAIPSVSEIKFTNKLKNHPVCLTSSGVVSTEMEKAMSAIPGNEIKASRVLEINENHDIVKKLNDLYKNDKEELKNYAKILYAQSLLIEGLSIDNPTEISNLIADIISK